MITLKQAYSIAMDTLKRFEDDWSNYIDEEARMNNYTPLVVLPPDIQADFGAEVFSATPTTEGVYRLVDTRRTQGSGYQGQRIMVLVVDENGQAIAGVPVAFSFSTAPKYTLTTDFAWQPPGPHKAFIARTNGGGECDQIQGSVIKANEPGGVTVYILSPEYSSDVITGAGMLADHTGLALIFQLRRSGVVSQADRLSTLEAWVMNFEMRVVALEGTQVREGKKPV